MKVYKSNRKFQFLFAFLCLIGIFIIVLGFNNTQNVEVGYKEDNSINYNVFLKKNQFFETPYLPEGRTYIASLIDYLDVTFKYNVTYDRKFNGDVKYKYVAQVRSNKEDGSGYYWEKEYDLSEEKVVNINNNDNVLISDNLKIDYNTYNDVLNRFKKAYEVNQVGELNIIMKIETKADFKKAVEPVETVSKMQLTIPLLQQALEVSVNKDTTNENNAIMIEEKSTLPAYLVLKITGIIIIIISLLCFIKATIFSRKFQTKNSYNVKLDRILKSYDSIIANVKELPNMSEFKTIEVSTFEELIDVYNEVRMPINYYQEGNDSIFIIINDSIIWIYTLKKDNSTKWVDDNEKEKLDPNRKR